MEEKKEHRFRDIIKARLKGLIIKTTSLAFITWVMIYITILQTGQQLDLNFYAFTAGVIGLKIWKGKGESESKI